MWQINGEVLLAMNTLNLLQLAKEVKSISDNLRSFNLLDEVAVNENTHSRILRLLLSYCENGKYPIYESFLKIDKIAKVFPDKFIKCVPIFFNERDRIDLLIEGINKQFAIIIENKINEAKDQDRQLERYLRSCINKGIPQSLLYVIYLTKDGTKKVSGYSLTDEAKQILETTDDSKGRFVEINFKEDITPWLSYCSSSFCSSNSTLISSAINMYLDYLNEWDGMREVINHKKYMEAVHNYGIKLDSIAELNTTLNGIDILSGELLKQRDSLCQDAAKQWITSPLKSYCEDNKITILSLQYSYDAIGIALSVKGIDKATFRFNTEGGGNIYGICNINVNDPLMLKNQAEERFCQSKFKHSEWWPAWKYHNKYKQPAELSFWENDVPNNSFFEALIQCYEEVVELLSN